MAKKKLTRKSRELEMFIIDRIGVQALLPREGNIITLTLAKDIKEKTDLSQADMKKNEVKTNNKGGLTWKKEKSGKKVLFTDAEVELLKTEIDKLDKTAKITPDILALCVAIKAM